MSTEAQSPLRREPGVAGSIVVAALLILWHAVRIPTFVILRLAQPLVELALGALGLLSIFGALFYEFLSPLPHPPFLLLMGFAVVCGVMLLVYETLLLLLSR